jgi:peptide/nickel transport system ATP-binding protein
MEICRQSFPARTDFGGGHWARCFLYSQGEEASHR